MKLAPAFSVMLPIASTKPTLPDLLFKCFVLFGAWLWNKSFSIWEVTIEALLAQELGDPPLGDSDGQKPR